jgi:hypothetical protein
MKRNNMKAGKKDVVVILLFLAEILEQDEF